MKHKEPKPVWAVIVTSKHSAFKELDSVHETEESALIASDDLYSSVDPELGILEVTVEPYELENLENG